MNMEKLPKLTDNLMLYNHNEPEKITKTKFSTMKFEYVDREAERRRKEEERLKKLNDSDYDNLNFQQMSSSNLGIAKGFLYHSLENSKTPIDFKQHIINELPEGKSHIESVLPKSSKNSPSKIMNGLIVKTHTINYKDVPNYKRTLTRNQYQSLENKNNYILTRDQNLIAANDKNKSNNLSKKGSIANSRGHSRERVSFDKEFKLNNLSQLNMDESVIFPDVDTRAGKAAKLLIDKQYKTYDATQVEADRQKIQKYSQKLSSRQHPNYIQIQNLNNLRRINMRRQSRTAHSRNHTGRNYNLNVMSNNETDLRSQNKVENASFMNVSHTSGFVMNMNHKVRATRKMRNLSIHNKDPINVLNYVKEIPSTRRQKVTQSRGNAVSQNRSVLPPPPYGKAIGHGILPASGLNYTVDLNELFERTIDSQNLDEKLINLTSHRTFINDHMF